MGLILEFQMVKKMKTYPCLTLMANNHFFIKNSLILLGWEHFFIKNGKSIYKIN